MFKKDDIVAIRPEWRDAGDSPDARYRVLADEEKGRVDLVLIGSGMTIEPVDTVSTDMIVKVDV